MDDNQLDTIAARYGTPTFVYDLEAIADRVRRLRSALPRADIRFAVKANPNGTVLALLAGLGVGAEAITSGELERSVRAGVPAARILLGGPGQHPALIRRALDLGVGLVSLDSASQWALWRDAATAESAPPRVLVRVNPGLDPRTHEHMATGSAESKFGLAPDEAEALALELVAADRLAGFHIHAGSQISDLGVYDEIFAVLEPLYARLGSLTQLDIGGGFAVPDFPLDAFAVRVRAFTERLGLALVVEPGRFLVAEAGVLLSRVVQVKRGRIHHVIADAGMADLLRPALYGAHHPVRRVGGADATVDATRVGTTRVGTTRVDVDGPLCENADRLGRGLELPHLEAGDLLAIEQAGAYGFSMASNYASSLRPAEVVVDGEEIRLVRERETVEDLIRLERP